jgi:hypothetical protein
MQRIKDKSKCSKEVLFGEKEIRLYFLMIFKIIKNKLKKNLKVVLNKL